MLSIIMVIFGFSLIVNFGYKLSKILLPEVEKLEQISLGYLLGIGVFTFIWFLFNWAGIPYNLLTGLVLLFLLNLAVFGVDRAMVRKNKEKPIFDLTYFKSLNIIEKFSFGVIVFLCISAFVQDIYWPIRYWDSLVLYDYRAKLFVLSGYMNEAISRGYFFGYPLLTSLSHAWVYLLGGTNPSFLYSLMYISLLVVFFFNVRKLNIGKTATIFLTAMVAVSPRLFDHTQWAYTNLPYSIYIILGSVYLYFGIQRKDFGTFITSAILIGLSTWTRSTEPFWLTYILIAAFSSILIKKWVWPVLYAVPVAVLMLPWRVFESIYNKNTVVNVAQQVVSTSYSVSQNLQLSVLKPVFDFIMTNVVLVYLLYFLLLAFIILSKIYHRSHKWLFIVIIIFNLGLVFGGTIMFEKYVSYWHDIPDSLTRMVMFIPVLVLFLSAEFLSEFKEQ